MLYSLRGCLVVCLSGLMMHSFADQDNQFSGEIPELIGQLTDVEEMFLQGNQLVGKIPRRYALR